MMELRPQTNPGPRASSHNARRASFVPALTHLTRMVLASCECPPAAVTRVSTVWLLASVVLYRHTACGLC
jgi:hypothetical protein